MIWDIVYHNKGEEYFQPEGTDTENRLDICFGSDGLEKPIRSNIDAVFTRNSCSPNLIAQDLMNVAIAVYTADKSVRRDRGYFGWERGLNIHIPVIHMNIWEKVKSPLQDLLLFLTDDRWRFFFRQSEPLDAGENQGSLLSPYPAVALLSGGLDSYIGAIDLLAKHDDYPIAFVSHHNQNGHNNKLQQNVVSTLSAFYPQRTTAFNFFVQPPKLDWEPEPSTRSRSFLFLAFAVAVATSLKSTTVIISENGFMSINVPLTRSRTGSHSTRTTHPNFLAGFRDLLYILGIAVTVENPYRFATKGEMIETCQNPQLLETGILLTHSCTRSNYFRFLGHSPLEHCGYCLPCLVRNAATLRAGISDVTYLRTEKVRKAQETDLWALNKLLTQYKSGSINLAAQVSKTGPISDSFDRYVAVYQRGLQELMVLLEQVL